jgi:glucose-1-phosphate cytidylyltransferase
MKVVLFCGGFGMRLREYSEAIPKPMVNIGYRPILWHVMKYYAHFGHKDFILCLGWQADAVKRYFLNYDECISNDFVLSAGGESVELLNRDIQDWNITFVDTGTSANIGERLQAVEEHLRDEETFLANYSDGLTDFYLPDLIEFHHQKQAVASLLTVKPMNSFHTIRADTDGNVRRLEDVGQADIWINAGFFVLNRQIFAEMRAGEELVGPPFQRLIEKEALSTLNYPGFFACMDTFKEKQCLDDMYSRGETPWEVWKHPLKDHHLHRLVEIGNDLQDDSRILEDLQSLSEEASFAAGRIAKEMQQQTTAGLGDEGAS